MKAVMLSICLWALVSASWGHAKDLNSAEQCVAFICRCSPGHTPGCNAHGKENAVLYGTQKVFDLTTIEDYVLGFHSWRSLARSWVLMLKEGCRKEFHDPSSGWKCRVGFKNDRCRKLILDL